MNAIEITVNQTGILGGVINEELTYHDMRDLSSLELSKLMGVGWNIGNSMEALYSTNDGQLTGDETSWGNPRITKQLIDLF
ncbi:MAG: hypothetical protein PF541_18080 [Prolixibacteraceae bacterium]|nr:hypothetical protein [Prolixibacteraceae bacterium]